MTLAAFAAVFALSLAPEDVPSPDAVKTPPAVRVVRGPVGRFAARPAIPSAPRSASRADLEAAAPPAPRAAGSARVDARTRPSGSVLPEEAFGTVARRLQTVEPKFVRGLDREAEDCARVILRRRLVPGSAYFTAIVCTPCEGFAFVVGGTERFLRFAPLRRTRLS